MRVIVGLISVSILLVVIGLLSERLWSDKLLSPLAENEKSLIYPATSTSDTHRTGPLVTFGDLIATVPSTSVLAVQARSPKVKSAERSVKIVLLGDSMTESLGHAPVLVTTLKDTYPSYQFEIINYGVGSTNIDYALERVRNGYTYKTKHFPSLIELRPDIVIVESFAYNQYGTGPETVESYRRKLIDIVHSLQWYAGARVLIMATLAPDATNYAKGVLELGPSKRAEIVAEKKLYLYTALVVGNELGVPNIDAFGSSLGNNGNGRPELTEDETNIHPSPQGTVFLQEIMAKSLIDSHILD